VDAFSTYSPENIRTKSESCPIQNDLCLLEKLGRGLTLGPITALISETVGYGASHLGMISNDRCLLWNEFYQIMRRYGYRSEKDALNALLPHLTIRGPVLEELIFRLMIQDIFLRRLLGKAIQAISPQNASWVDSRIGKTFRIILSAALFGAFHLIGTEGQTVFKFQAFYAFAGGCFLGAIKESRLGLAGSIGCHMSNNILASLDVYANCLPVLQAAGNCEFRLV